MFVLIIKEYHKVIVSSKKKMSKIQSVISIVIMLGPSKWTSTKHIPFIISAENLYAFTDINEASILRESIVL